MVVISLPIAWIVVQFVPNKELVFIAFPIAELLAAIVSYLLYLHNGKNWNEEELGQEEQEELVIS
jgi:Na+-driven multidrug efflux pump